MRSDSTLARWLTQVRRSLGSPASIAGNTQARRERAVRRLRAQETAVDPWLAEERVLLSAPAVVLSVTDATYIENTPPVTLDPAITASDPDADLIIGAQVKITDYVMGQDQLSFTPQLGIAGSFDSMTGILTLTGIRPAGFYATVLSSVKYVNLTDAPSDLSRTIEFRLTDSQLEMSAPVTLSLHLISVADTPADVNMAVNEDTLAGPIVLLPNPLDGATVTHFRITGITNGTLYLNSGVTVGNGTFVTAADAAAGLNFLGNADYFGPAQFKFQAATGNTLADLGGNLATAAITVNPVADTMANVSATVAEDTLSAGIILTPNPVDGASVTHFRFIGITNGTLYLNDGVTELHNSDFITLAQASGGLKFKGDANYFGPAEFKFQAATGNSVANLGGNLATASITVTPVADTPANVMATVAEDTFSGPITLLPNPLDGASVTHFQITGITSGTLYLNDQMTVVNNNDFVTLAQASTLKFKADANYFGPAEFKFQAAVGPLLTDRGGAIATASITVNPVADTPANVAVVVDEETLSGPIVLTPNGVDLGGVTHFQITGITNGTLYLNNGTTVVNNNDFITVGQATAGLKYQGAANYFGPAEFKFRAALGPLLADRGGALATAMITVTNVNDPPTIVVPGAQATDEGTLLPINGIVINDVDFAGNLLTVQFQTTGPTASYTLGTTTGITFLNGTTNGGSTPLEIQGTLANLQAALATLQVQPHDNGLLNLTIVITDELNVSAQDTIPITVANVAPTLTLVGPPTANEGAFVTVTGSATDPANMPTTPTNNDPLTYTWSVTKDNVAYTSGMGNVANFQVVDNGIYVVTMIVTDGDMGSDTEMHTITVANVAPTLTLVGPPTANEGAFVTVTGSATDPANTPTTPTDNDPLTFTWSVTKDNVAYASGMGDTANFQVVDNGVYVVTMIVTDGDMGSDTETHTITVANVAPTLTLVGPPTANEGTFVTVTGTATDPANMPTTPTDNDPLTYTWSVTKDNVAYASGMGDTANFQVVDNGVYVVTMTVTDGDMASDTEMHTITVANVAPTLTLVGLPTANEGAFVTVTGSATDPANTPTTPTDNDPLTFTWSVTKDNVAYASGMGDTANFQVVDNGVYVVTMTVTDGDMGTDTEMHTINVANVAPTLTLVGPPTANEGTFVTVTGSATDPANTPTTPTDNDPLTFTWSVTKDNVAYASGMGDTANFQVVDNGVYVVTMTVTDGDTGSDTETHTITVANVAPTLTLVGPPTANEGGFVTVTGSATDPANMPTTPTDNDPLTYMWSVTKDNVAYTSGMGNVANFQVVDNGVYVVTMTVTDGDMGSDTEMHTITVANVAPTLTLVGPPTANEGAFVTVTGSATDPANTPTTPTDNDPLTYTWSVTKDNVAYASGMGNVANFQVVDNGVYVVTMIVTDGDMGSDTETHTINVANVAPTLTLVGPPTANEGSFVTVTGSATDPANMPTTPTDNDLLTYTWSVTKDNVAYISGMGDTANFQVVDNGVYVVTMIVTDGDMGSDTETHTITVANVAPTLTLVGPPTANEGAFVTVTGSATDPANMPTTPTNNDPLTYTWSVTKDNVAYTSGMGNVANFQVIDNGVYVVTMTVTDGDMGSDTETHTINVANVAPTLTLVGPAPNSVFEGGFITVTGSATDPANMPTTPTNNDSLTYVWSATKDGNPYAAGLGNIANFQVVDNGVYVITMTVTDDDLGIDTETFTITVLNVAPTPTITGATTGIEGTSINLSASSTDPANMPTTPTNNDSVTYSWQVFRNSVLYTTGAGTNFTLTPNNEGTYEVYLTASDEDGGSDTTLHTITVANVAPSVAPLPGKIEATDINGQFYTYVEIVVTDPGNDNISVLIVWGDINPNDFLNDPFLVGESAATPRTFPTISHRYLTAPNPQDPLAPVTITFFINDGTTTVIETRVVAVTEQGIPAGGVYITPEPEQIVLPAPQSIIVPPAIVTQPAQQQVRNEEIVSREDQQTDEVARLVLHVVGPTGIEGPAVTLPDGLLQNLRGLFTKLPDGHYRVYLVQGESRRLVIEAFVRQGRAIDPAEADQGTQERPPQVQPAAQQEPVQQEPDRVMQAAPVGQAVPDKLVALQDPRTIAAATNPSQDSDPTVRFAELQESEAILRQAEADLRETHESEPQTPENADPSSALSLAAAGVVAGTSWRRSARRQRAAAGTTGPDSGEKIEKSWSRLARRARQWKPR